jgi:hypothetical protein
MTDIVKLEDADGNVHYTARGSQKAKELLRDGATDLDPLTAPDPPADPEVNDAAPSGQGDDHDAGTTGSGSGKRQRAPRTADHGDQAAG